MMKVVVSALLCRVGTEKSDKTYGKEYMEQRLNE